MELFTLIAGKMIDYEEKGNDWGTLRSWLFVLTLSGSLIAWAMFMMSMIKAVPRVWDFGTVEFTPSKSVYSTHKPNIRTNEKMIAPLPEGISMEDQNLQKQAP